MTHPLFAGARRAFTAIPAAIILLTSTAVAQTRPSYTLGDVLHALDVGATVGNLAAANPVAHHMLDSVSAFLYADGNTSLTVAQVAERIQSVKRLHDSGDVPNMSWTVVNRTDRATGALSDPNVRLRAFNDAVWTAVELGNLDVVNALRNRRIPSDSISVLLAPLDSLNSAKLRLAHVRNQTLLKHFERKYGPKSASLNLLEVGLNYAAQFNLLRTTETSGPSPFEIIANYGASSVRIGTTTNDPSKIVTNGRVGFRYYFFGDDWGGNGRVTQYLLPAYMSAGVITTGPDGSVGRVWGRGYHAGPFIGWGDFFAGYLIDSKHRIIAGVQKTLIPGVL